MQVGARRGRFLQGSGCRPYQVLRAQALHGTRQLGLAVVVVALHTGQRCGDRAKWPRRGGQGEQGSAPPSGPGRWSPRPALLVVALGWEDLLGAGVAPAQDRSPGSAPDHCALPGPVASAWS